MLNDPLLFIWIWLITLGFAYLLGREHGQRQTGREHDRLTSIDPNA
jgi:hypothetical protein